ncbi:MAG: hypothetical protein KCHDKBKB_00660 [Elusimicrobia bacterium]|nr:hypothetical protein [Elusimicrobiota bacterium]
MPIRVQRKRTKGWKMPPNTIYVGRPTFWGNPYKEGDRINGIMVLGRGGAIAKYKEWLMSGVHDQAYDTSCTRSQAAKRDLRGFNLACWCPLDKPCHADVLLEIANS